MPITAAELSQLNTCRTEFEWNNICSAILRSRGGKLPIDWFMKVMPRFTEIF